MTYDLTKIPHLIKSLEVYYYNKTELFLKQCSQMRLVLSLHICRYN